MTSASTGIANSIGCLCPLCGEAGHSKCGQTVIGGQLRWYRSTECPVGGRTEEDGVGEPPAEIRALLLETGPWSVAVTTEAKLDAIRAVSALLPHATRSELLAAYPILPVGTEIEAAWIAERLRRDGFGAEPRRT